MFRGIGRSWVESEFAQQPNGTFVISAPIQGQGLVDQKDTLCLAIRVRGQPLLDGSEILGVRVCLYRQFFPSRREARARLTSWRTVSVFF